MVAVIEIKQFLTDFDWKPMKKYIIRGSEVQEQSEGSKVLSSFLLIQTLTHNVLMSQTKSMVGQ